MRYWYHPESDSLFTTTEDDEESSNDGLVEELDIAEYLEIQNLQAINQRAFNYAWLPRQEIDATTTKQGRVYHTPVGDLRSVTTILRHTLKHDKLDKWRNEIGHAKADAISQQAMHGGEVVHEACERYLKGHAVNDMMMPSNMSLFLEARTILDRHITKIYGVEFPLYSVKLQAAGRADGLVEWLKHNVILDFKTCRKRLDKSDDRIFRYNLQTTAYAMMAEELYNIKFPYNVLVFLPSTDYPHIVIKTNEKYRPLVQELFDK